MLPGLLFQWVRGAVTQQVIDAARGELHAELQARMAAAGEGTRRCPIGVVCGESLEAETLETMLENRVRFVSDRLTIVQGFLPTGDEPGDEIPSGAGSGDGKKDGETPGDAGSGGDAPTRPGVWMAVAWAGRGRGATLRAAQAIMDGHRPRLVISAGFCTALTPELRARELLLVHRIVPDDEIDDESRRDEPREADTGGAECVRGRGDGSDDRNGTGSERGGALVPVSGATAETGMRCGALVTVGRIADLPRTTAARRRLARRTGAVAADTNAEPVVEFCRSRGIPVLVLRGVRETFHERFSDEVRHYQRRNTTTGRIGALIGAFLDRDGAVSELQRWDRRGRAISERLADAVVEIVLDAMSAIGGPR